MQDFSAVLGIILKLLRKLYVPLVLLWHRLKGSPLKAGGHVEKMIFRGGSRTS